MAPDADADADATVVLRCAVVFSDGASSSSANRFWRYIGSGWSVEPAFGSQLCETCAAPAEDGGVGTSTSSTDGMEGALSMAAFCEDG